MDFKFQYAGCVCTCLVAKLCPTLLGPHGLYPTRLLCPWDFPGENTGVGCQSPSLEDLPDPKIKPMSPALAGGFFMLSHKGIPNT